MYSPLLIHTYIVNNTIVIVVTQTLFNCVFFCFLSVGYWPKFMTPSVRLRPLLDTMRRTPLGRTGIPWSSIIKKGVRLRRTQQGLTIFPQHGYSTTMYPFAWILIASLDFSSLRWWHHWHRRSSVTCSMFPKIFTTCPFWRCIIQLVKI